MKKIITMFFVFFVFALAVSCQKEEKDMKTTPTFKKERKQMNSDSKRCCPKEEKKCCPREDKCCSSAKEVNNQSMLSNDNDDEAVKEIQEEVFAVDEEDSEDFPMEELNISQDEELDESFNISEIQKDTIDLDTISENTLDSIEINKDE
ncbi:MAG: hypothetical protein JXA94_01920 [Parachlamydiales bacterium]|nr:hypothetical protein [Parachlamydiales bacterium]